MALSAGPNAERPKLWSFLAVPSLQLIQKLYMRKQTKRQKSQQLIDTT
jgi:hypothetical protein